MVAGGPGVVAIGSDTIADRRVAVSWLSTDGGMTWTRGAIEDSRIPPGASSLIFPRLNAVAWTADGSGVVTGHSDGSLALWDVRTRAPVTSVSLASDGGRVVDMVTARDGSSIAAALERGSVYVWDGRGAANFAASTAI